MTEPQNLFIGQRLALDTDQTCYIMATIRFIGSVQNDKHSRRWVGVEIDKLALGKEECRDFLSETTSNQVGYLGGHQYFLIDERVGVNECLYCSRFKVKSASLFLPVSMLKSLQFGINFFQALKMRYGYSDDIEKSLPNHLIEPVEICGKQVQFVGFHHATQHFQKISNLKCIDVQECSIQCSGYHLQEIKKNKDIHLKSFLTIENLFLGNNLFTSCIDIFDILVIMPNVHFVSLCGLIFEKISNPPLHDLYSLLKNIHCFSIIKGLPFSIQFANVTHLDLTSTNAGWLDILQMGQNFVALKELNLSDNVQLFDIHGLQMLQRLTEQEHFVSSFHLSTVLKLHVQSCGLTSYSHINYLFILLPNITCLNLNNNCLINMLPDYVTNLPIRVKDCFEKLKQLVIDSNHVDDIITLQSIAELCPNLEIFRFNGNPLYNIGMKCFETCELPIFVAKNDFPRFLRQIIISLFPQLVLFNGTEIQSYERRQTELYFLSLCCKYNGFWKLLDPKDSHKNRLLKLYANNISIISNEMNHSNNKIQKNILVSFKRLGLNQTISSISATEITHSLPSWLLVSSVKTFIEKHFNILVQNQNLSFSTQKHNSLRIPLEDDDRTLESYGIENKVTIYVDVFSCE
jgi:NADH:ubiquinone oxidoreductase subunit C